MPQDAKEYTLSSKVKEESLHQESQEQVSL